MSSSVRRARSDNGQAMVEFAMVLPFLCVLVLGILQFGMTLNNYVTITDAARVGARQAVVTRLGGSTIDEAKDAVFAAAGSLDESKLDVSVESPDWTKAGSDVVVTATYPYEINLLGWVVASGDLTSSITERLE